METKFCIARLTYLKAFDSEGAEMFIQHLEIEEAYETYPSAEEAIKYKKPGVYKIQKYFVQKKPADMTTQKKPAKKAAKKTTKVNRSAKSGKFVSEEFADKNPDTTFKDTIKNGNGTRERLS